MSVSSVWMRRMVAAGVVAASVGLPPAASAQQSVLQCQGSETDAYSPGVIFQPRAFTITLTGQFSSCIDSGGQVTGGRYGPEQFTLVAGCDDLLESFQGPRTFVWSNGESSVVQGSGQSTEIGGQVITTIIGTVIEGRFLGENAVQTITLPQPGLLQCLTTGYTGATGVTTLTLG